MRRLAFLWVLIAALLASVSSSFAQSHVPGQPGGSSSQVQWNNGGQFAGTSGITCTATTCTIAGGTGPFLPLTGGTLTGGLMVSGASFGLSGNISAPAWTTSGVRYKNAAATLTDTSSSGTVAAAYTDLWGGNTIAASSATTFTQYYGSYFKVPVAGTNVTFTNAYALGADSIAVPAGGTISVRGDLAVGFTSTGDTILQFNLNGSNAMEFQFASSSNTNMAFAGSAGAFDTWLTRVAPAVWQLGTIDAASPVAQTLGVQSVVAGTTNTAGALWKLADSAGTGNAASGGYEWDVHPAGSSGTGQNSASASFAISGAGIPSFHILGSAGVGTAYLCWNSSGGVISEDTTCTVSAARFKNIKGAIKADPALAALHPVSFTYKDGVGTPGVHVGLIADDVAKLDKRCAVYDKRGQVESYDDKCVIGHMVASIQAQQAEIEALKRSPANDNPSCRLAVMGRCWW